MNITVVTGVVSQPPVWRTLQSGDELVAFDVTTSHPDRPAESVPVVWSSPPATAATVAPGEAVVVVGRVRRRFFRAGGATQSRTEVVADGVALLRRPTAAGRLAADAIEALEAGVAAMPSPRRRAR